MLSLPMLSSLYFFPLVAAPIAPHDQMPRPIISPATNLESTLTKMGGVSIIVNQRNSENSAKDGTVIYFKGIVAPIIKPDVAMS
jgi:hypothetical protein